MKQKLSLVIGAMVVGHSLASPLLRSQNERGLQVAIDDGAVFFLGGTTSLDFDDAQALCESQGGILAEVYSIILSKLRREPCSH